MKTLRPSVYHGDGHPGAQDIPEHAKQNGTGVDDMEHGGMEQEHGKTAGAGAHAGGYRIYAVTWFWLLVITVLELGVVVLGIPKALLAVTLITMALLKAALIMAYFMHLRHEKMSLIYAVVVPMYFLAIVLFSGVGPDALSVFNFRR